MGETLNIKLSVYHPGEFTNLNKMAFASQISLLLLYLMDRSLGWIKAEFNINICKQQKPRNYRTVILKHEDEAGQMT
jgi:hypothetical protein